MNKSTNHVNDGRCLATLALRYVTLRHLCGLCRRQEFVELLVPHVLPAADTPAVAAGNLHGLIEGLLKDW